MSSPAQTVYLLPGLLCDGSIWAHQSDRLRALGFDTRVADYRHCTSIAEMARTVLYQAPDIFSIAGHSMGGRVAIQIWRTAPERVARLALLDTGAEPRRTGEAEKRRILVDLAHAKGMTALAAAWLPPMVHPDRLSDATLMGRLTAMVERMSPTIFEGQIQALLTRPDAEAAVRGIRCPVLVGVGRQDGWSPLDQHETLAQSIPGARLVVYEECGHMSPVEAPDAVTSSLIDWLREPAFI